MCATTTQLNIWRSYQGEYDERSLSNSIPSGEKSLYLCGKEKQKEMEEPYVNGQPFLVTGDARRHWQVIAFSTHNNIFFLFYYQGIIHPPKMHQFKLYVSDFQCIHKTVQQPLLPNSSTFFIMKRNRNPLAATPFPPLQPLMMLPKIPQTW